MQRGGVRNRVCNYVDANKFYLLSKRWVLFLYIYSGSVMISCKLYF